MTALGIRSSPSSARSQRTITASAGSFPIFGFRFSVFGTDSRSARGASAIEKAKTEEGISGKGPAAYRSSKAKYLPNEDDMGTSSCLYYVIQHRMPSLKFLA